MGKAYRVMFDTQPRTQMKLLSAAVQREFLDELRAMAQHPHDYPHQPLQHKLSGSFKLRIGDRRLIYTLHHDRQLIRVWRIGPRANVYRGYEPMEP